MRLSRFLFIYFLFTSISYATSYKPLDGIVALVNNDLVMRSELDAEVQKIAKNAKRKGLRLPPKADLEKQVLEKLIVKRLQLNAAKKAGIVVDDGAIGRALNQIAARNKMSLGQFRKALERTGMRFDTFKKQMREQYLLSRLRSQTVLSKVKVSRRELDSFLRKAARAGDENVSYRVGHILIAVPEGAESEKLIQLREEADRLVKKLKSGADFRDMAAKHSDGSNALEGGDLGWRKRGELPTMLADHVYGLKQSEIAGPIRSGSGFHIIKLLQKKGFKRHVVNQTKARHILIRTNEVTSDEDAKIRLQQLRKRIIGGDDFAALARSHSKDTATAIKGGSLGWLGPDQVFVEFKHEMEALEPGQISMPFRTQMGWHLLQVEDRRNHDSTDDLRRSKAAALLKKRKGEEAVEQYIRRLRDEAYVEIRLRNYD